MATIDASDLLSDPDFTDDITVIHRATSINDKGRSQVVETEETITAVVQPGSGKMLDYLPEATRMRGSCTVWSVAELSADTGTSLPDIIVWRGKRYIVSIVYSFENYGTGYYKAACILEPVNNG